MADVTRPSRGNSLLAGKPDHYSYTTSWLLKQLLAQSSLHGPVSDPTQSGYAQRKGLGIHSRIKAGYIVDYVAYAHCYRVFLDNNHPIIPCTLLMQGSSTPWGARSVVTLPPGCGVRVLVHPQQTHGLIVGVEPRRRADAADSKGDWISQAGRCGVRVDGVHRQVFQCTGKGGVVDWSTNRPMDALTGEAGWITETGLRVILDPFLAQLAASEVCGVWAFYHDDLLRLAGYNLQQFTCCSDLEVLDDEGEARWVGGFAAYPWEQAGALRPGVDPFRDVDPQAVQVDTPHYSYVEPADDRQLPFHRLREYRGYLGQGSKRQLVLPPAGDRYSLDSDPPEGVFEEFLSLTGRYSLRSAKAIHIRKRVAVPAPQPRRRPEDPAGENPDTYRASGVWGEGDPHKVVGGPKTSGPNPHLQQVMALADLHAWAFNWEASHPFHYHQGGDWDLPEESATRLAGAARPPQFGRLASSFYLPPPQAVYLTVDHRYGKVAYYPNEAGFDLTDDGAVVLGDGYGAEIRMVGGHIFFDCPGDIWLRSGRNVNTWAGRDAIVKAKQSVDVSATDGDVRVKSEANLHMLAGNGKYGGVLIESRAPSAYEYEDKVGEDVVTGGIQLRAGKGAVVTWSRDLYLRTGGGDLGGGGQIVLDAAQGKSPIVTHSQSFISYLADSRADYFGTEGDVQAANLYSATGTILAKALEVGGPGIFGGMLLVNGWIEAVGGHIATEKASDPKYVYVSPLKEKSLDEAREVLDKAADAENDAIDAARRTYKQEFADYWYAAKGPGNDKVIQAAHFTHRSGDQYRTKDFALHEARWQQLTRLAGAAVRTWGESAVTVNNRDTYPYPGKEAWTGNHLHRQDLALYDAAAGRAQDRAAAQEKYEAPEFAEPQGPVPLEGNYVVIL